MLRFHPVFMVILTVPPFHLELHGISKQNFRRQHLGRNRRYERYR